MSVASLIRSLPPNNVMLSHSSLCNTADHCSFKKRKLVQKVWYKRVVVIGHESFFFLLVKFAFNNHLSTKDISSNPLRHYVLNVRQLGNGCEHTRSSPWTDCVTCAPWNCGGSSTPYSRRPSTALHFHNTETWTIWLRQMFRDHDIHTADSGFR